MRRLIPTVLACLLLAPRGAIADAGRPIPQDAGRQQQRYRDMLAWNQRTLVGAYDKVGKKDPRWDKPARDALDAAARLFSHAADPDLTPAEIFEPARQAVEAGCDDPLVLYVYARSSPSSDPDEAATFRRRFATAVAALERSAYPPFRRAVALYKFGLSEAYRPDSSPTSRKEAARMLDAALALLPRSVAQDERTPDVEHLWFELLQAYVLGHRKLDGDFQAAFRRIDARLPKDPASRAIRLQVEAEFLIKYAWEARGSGTADTVTEEGWRKFNERLTQARKDLETAWTLKPGDSQTATLMLTVETGIGGGDRAEMEKWFERAMEAGGSRVDACEVKMNWLDPKWHGTPEDLLAFGHACRDTKNWRAGITLLLADAHLRIAKRMPEIRGDLYLRSAEVWKDVKGVFEEYLQHCPNDAASRSLYAAYCYSCGRYDQADEQFRAVGDRLVGSGSYPLSWMEEARAAAARRARPRPGAPLPEAPAPRSGEIGGPPPEGFRPLELSWSDPSGGAGTLAAIDGCLPTDAGFDVLWDSRSVYLLKDRERATRVYTDAGRYVSLMDPCYDGRFVWMPIQSASDPSFLLVIDPATGKTRQITRADGLPVLSPDDLPAQDVQFLSVAPIAPGKVCMAGVHKTSWIATIAFDPGSGTGPSIRTFHEARDAPNDNDPDDWKRTTLKFRPQYMATLTAPAGDKAPRRILLGRSASIQANVHPLLIDPEARTVEALPVTIGLLRRGSLFPGSFEMHQGRFYWVEIGANREGTLMRLGLPDLAGQPLVRGLARADKVAILGDRVQVVGDRWWEASLTGREARPLSVELPWALPDRGVTGARAGGAGSPVRPKPSSSLTGICRSHHLGLLVLTRWNGRDRITYQVEPAEMQTQSGRESK